DSRLRGNDEFRDYGVVGNDESIHTETCTTSFPRKWESRNEKQQEFIGNDRNRTDWIPACAGMTGF
ncbi:TPA: hypothetical protein ACJJPI_002146, partial [Neisseria meningitidis]